MRTRRLAWTDLISYSFEQSSTTDHQQGYGRAVSNPGSILSRGVANFPYNLTNSKFLCTVIVKCSLNYSVGADVLILFYKETPPHPKKLSNLLMRRPRDPKNKLPRGIDCFGIVRSRHSSCALEPLSSTSVS